MTRYYLRNYNRQEDKTTDSIHTDVSLEKNCIQFSDINNIEREIELDVSRWFYGLK